MAVINGTKLILFVDGTAVGSLRDNSITISDALIGATTKDSNGWDESISGLKSFNGTGSGLYDPLNSNVTADDIVAKIIAGTKCEVAFGTGDNSDIAYYGDIYFENLSLAAPMEDAASYDFSFKGTAALTKGTFPIPS